MIRICSTLRIADPSPGQNVLQTRRTALGLSVLAKRLFFIGFDGGRDGRCTAVYVSGEPEWAQRAGCSQRAARSQRAVSVLRVVRSVDKGPVGT